MSSVRTPTLFLVITLFDFNFTPCKGFIGVETTLFLLEAAAYETEIACLDLLLLLFFGGGAWEGDLLGIFAD